MVGDARLLLSDGALLCLDTSALLEVLRMPSDDADLFLSTLESLKKRVVIPPTVAAEVRDIGLEKVEEAIRIETASTKHTGRFLDKPQGAGAEHHDEFIAAVLAVSENFRSKVRANIERRFERVLDLIQDCIGPQLPPDMRLQVLAEAPNRYLRQQPPGYTDARKAARGEAAYGDVFIFFEMIHVARERGADVSFITNDSKEDWWEIDPLVIPRRLLCGRRELSQEFRARSARAFSIFHGLRFVSDLNDLNLLFSQAADAFREWEKRAALWSGRSALQRMLESIADQNDWLRRVPRVYDFASLNPGMKRHEQLIRDMQRGNFGNGFTAASQAALRSIVSPSIEQIISRAQMEFGRTIAPTVTRALGLDRLSANIAAATRSSQSMMNAWQWQVPESVRLLRDMTFHVPSFTAPYLNQVKALMESVRDLPRVHPAVMRLDDLAKTTTPERRSEASALRRMYSRRRRALRRSLRGKRINLLDEHLPLKRVLVYRAAANR